MQTNMFQYLHPTFKFDKKNITLFEAFAGVGSQSMALKLLSEELGFNLESVGISEFDKYCDFVYQEIHGEVKNYGDITKIKQLPNDIDIFTYSFPCQDISLAGDRKGLTKGDGTRSGLLWEVERLLKTSQKPTVLLMENVKALISEQSRPDFVLWLRELEKMGYTNYWQVLNAKDYEIPQNRDRVFCVSIFGEWNYDFPEPMPLKLRLKDLLEDSVDEKYDLSAKMLEYIVADNEKWTGNNDKSLVNKSVASALNTAEGSRICDASNYILNGCTQEDLDLKKTKIAYAPSSREYKNQGWKDLCPTLKARDYKDPKVVLDYVEKGQPKILIPETPQLVHIGNVNIGANESNNRVYSSGGLCPTLNTMEGGHRQPKILIPEATKKGYAEAGEGDGVYINRPHQKRGCVQKNMIPTIKTSGDDVGVVVKQENLRIRKLTPKECWRLMGFKDSDFMKAEKVVSNSQLYKQAGNSIVVNVLYQIFKQLF